MQEGMRRDIDRRSFIGGLAVAAAGAATVLGGCSSAGAEGGGSGETAGWMPETWEGEYDIVVVGCGGAGAAAGITAVDEGLGDVVVLEAAGEGRAGGNTRTSGQMIFCPDTVDAAVKYQTNMNKPYTVEEDLMRAWAENLCENVEWLQDLGLNPLSVKSFNPEFPETEGSEGCNVYAIDGKSSNETLWTPFFDVFEDLGVPIVYDTRVTKLVQNPETREIVGVVAEDGRAFKARKGVVLSCGGFEANTDMLEQYFELGYTETYALGCYHNRGDGIKMAQSAGAQMWHMNNTAGYTPLPAVRLPEDGDDAIATYCNLGLASSYATLGTDVAAGGQDYLMVDMTGKRFANEDVPSLYRHGKYLVDGLWKLGPISSPHYYIIGSETMDSTSLIPTRSFYRKKVDGVTEVKDNQGYIDAGVIVKADTVEELAEKIELDPTVLAETVSTYNGYARDNFDQDFGRGQAVYDTVNISAHYHDSDEKDTETPAIKPYDLAELKAPYYAIRGCGLLLNTQGGPKRGVDGGVLDAYDEPIPRLYGAGELGTVYAYQYNGGGNVSEALSSGRLAARSIAALDPWE